MDQKPFSASSDRNRHPILDVLQSHFADRNSVLEIGSGTGQHAVHFAAALPQLRWQPSDLSDQHAGIQAWLAEAQLPNLLPPIALDVGCDDWPERRYDAVYTSNTLHIMSWFEVVALFERLDEVMEPDCRLVVYGPFKYGGDFTSPSNAEFDRWLKGSAPHRGIRDFEAVDALAQRLGLRLLEDRPMPANNQCLVWARS
jgi:cyclopropane fatty-acyl-phospholipid synthase-like methyltransferase